MVKYRLKLPLAIAVLLGSGCGPAEDVAVQELPELTRASPEARLGLPEVRGAWRFAGWELEEGDSLGVDAELPSFGTLMLQAQKRDSLAGYYVTAAGRAPLFGEVRRDRVVSLVTYPQPGDGRYLVGEVMNDTLWLEGSSLGEPGSWRGEARAAFIRSQTAATPFLRVRGVNVATPVADSSTVLTSVDSSGVAGAEAPSLIGRPSAGGQSPIPTDTGVGNPNAGRPTAIPRAEGVRPVRPPVSRPAVTQSPVEETVDEPEPEPEPVRPRTPPRVIGEPVVRDTDGGGLP